MGAVWRVVKKRLALALAMAEKGAFVLQGHGNPQQVRAALFGSGSIQVCEVYRLQCVAATIQPTRTRLHRHDD